VPNLVANGSFEGAASPWTLGVKSPAAGTLGLDPTSAAAGTSSALIAITSATPGNPYNVQLTQRQIPVVAGGQYALSFAAKADAPRDMVVSCQQRATPYTVYFRQKNIALTTTWQRFTYTATSTGSDAASMLNFNLSGAAGKVWLDDVQLSCTAGC
jgi:endoglucanase